VKILIILKIISENNGQAVLKIINSVLRESIVKLNEEKIPICIVPGIIYVHLINDMKNQKVSFQEVEIDKFDKENNYSLVFKIMSIKESVGDKNQSLVG
jgi:hypothetical protein